MDTPQQVPEAAVSRTSPLVVGNQNELGANPHPVYMHGRPIVIYGVQDGDLVTIGALSLVGATCFTLFGYVLSAYQSYSIALQTTSGLAVQTISDYKLYVWASEIGLIIFGLGALASALSVWRKIRNIKKYGELYVWADGRLIPAEDPNKGHPSLWRKFRARIYNAIDKRVTPPSLL
jgi:hypothetical protein